MYKEICIYCGEQRKTGHSCEPMRQAALSPKTFVNSKDMKDPIDVHNRRIIGRAHGSAN